MNDVVGAASREKICDLLGPRCRPDALFLKR